MLATFYKFHLCPSLLALLTASSLAANLSADVIDSAGKPVRDAVVYAQVQGSPPVVARGVTAVVDQVDREFTPFVTPVQIGTSVRFPNRDNIRHSVYSFSPAKTFSIDLYKGTAAAPVLMDKSGPVVLGCNIHDHMLAYILVVDTPHFGASPDSGRVMLRDLAPGRYEVRVWHPRMQDMPDALVQIVTVSTRDAQISFRLALKPERRLRH